MKSISWDASLSNLVRLTKTSSNRTQNHKNQQIAVKGQLIAIKKDTRMTYWW